MEVINRDSVVALWLRTTLFNVLQNLIKILFWFLLFFAKLKYEYQGFFPNGCPISFCLVETYWLTRADMFI